MLPGPSGPPYHLNLLPVMLAWPGAASSRMSDMTQLVFWIVAGSAILAVCAVLLSWGRPGVRI